jgi:hypothetical protein
MMDPILRTNADLSATEAIVDAVSAHSAGCNGCRKTGRQIMVSFTVNNDPRHNGEITFYDMMLTEQQARQLVVDIERRLVQNVDDSGALQ